MVGTMAEIDDSVKKKVPELRFKGFTDEWEERKLGDISYKVKEKNKTGEFTETLTNSAEYGIINQRDFFNKDISNAKNLTGYYVVKNDDFVYNPRISNFAPVGPIKRNKLGRTGVMSPLYYVFRTHDIDKNYLEKYFDTVYWHRFMKLNGDSGVRADRFAIKDSVFVEMPIPYPTIEEQEKIGSFFKQLDDTIALHQRKLDLLKEQKKGFLQKMFPKNGAKVPELRFAGFTDDWEERKLGDVTTWTKGQGLTKEDLNEERDGSEAVHYADLYKFSPVMHNVIHWTNSDDGRIIPDNSLLFPASDVTPVGLARASTLRLSGVKAGGDVIIGQLDESINSSFMSYQINANSKKILPLITGTTVKHVQAKSLATVSVSITNMAEQTAIAGIFERIDNLIALHQRKLDLLKEQKKGFLQKMFV